MTDKTSKPAPAPPSANKLTPKELGETKRLLRDVRIAEGRVRAYFDALYEQHPEWPVNFDVDFDTGLVRSKTLPRPPGA